MTQDQGFDDGNEESAFGMQGDTATLLKAYEQMREALEGVTVRWHDEGPCFCRSHPPSASYVDSEHMRTCVKARAALADLPAVQP